MTENEPSNRYKLKEVCIRLAEGHPLYSDVPLSSPGAALQVMRKEMSQYDRECLCVVNLNTKLQPINFNIVSVGELNQSIHPASQSSVRGSDAFTGRSHDH